MSREYEVVNDALLVREVKDGFASLNFNGLELSLRDRAGSEYGNFSNKVVVIHTFKDSEYLVGSVIIVHHFVKDQIVSIDEEDFLLCYPEQIIAKKCRDNHGIDDDRYLEDFKCDNGYLAYPELVESESIFESWGNKQTNHKTNSTTTLSGEKIEYLDNADYELYHNEKLVFFIKEEHIYSINNILQTKYFTEVSSNVVSDPKRTLKTLNGTPFTINENVLGIKDE